MIFNRTNFGLLIITALILVWGCESHKPKNYSELVVDAFGSGYKFIPSENNINCDSLVLVSPYARIESSMEDYGVDLSSLSHTNIAKLDNIFIFGFVANNELFGYAILPSKKYHPRSFEEKIIKIPCDKIELSESEGYIDIIEKK